MSRILFIFLLINAFFESIYCTCTRDVIWQSNFCPLNMNINGAILPPDNATCRFQAGDVLRLINSDANRTENIYQVRTREDWENCNATNAFNSMPRLVSDTNTVNLVTGNFFTFNIAAIVYFISTSNGSEDSANNDRIGTSPCLRMSFLLIPHSADCTLLPVCNESVLSADSNVLNVGCNFGLSSFPTVTSTSVMPSLTMMGTVTTSMMSSTVSSTLIMPTSTSSSTPTPTTTLTFPSSNFSTQNDDECFILSLGIEYCYLGILGIIVASGVAILFFGVIILLMVAIYFFIKAICKGINKVSPDRDNTFYGDLNNNAITNQESTMEPAQLVNAATDNPTGNSGQMELKGLSQLYESPIDPPQDLQNKPTDSILYETTY